MTRLKTNYSTKYVVLFACLLLLLLFLRGAISGCSENKSLMSSENEA